MKFFKIVFATVVGLVIFSGIFIFFSISILTGMAASSMNDKEVKEIKENSILKLDFKNQIIEKGTEENPFQGIEIPMGESVGKIGLVEISNAIKNAKTDNKIKGIYLDLSFITTGSASLEVIRKSLVDFKESGKFIISYSELMSEGAYYLASVADEVHLYPEGMVEFNGLSSEVIYFTGLFEKLGVEATIFKVGKFKSAVEPFFRKDMSDYNRQQITSFLNSLYDHYIEEISVSRNISKERLHIISDSMLVRNAEDAVTYGLADKNSYYDEVENLLKEKSGVKEEDETNFVSLKKYMRSIPKSNSSSKNKIAVIVASGEITSGKSGDGVMGSETVAKAIKEARIDQDVKAIVLRVNSPGGSALASDVMWREVMLAKKVKPVIASMGDVAASGGYYISMGCDKIYAEPNTITGSIGVFGLMFNTEDLMNNKLGITFDRVKTGEFSDVPNLNRKMTPFEEQVIQNGVDEIYADFTAKAAQGRNMNVDSLRKIASGRVWSGVEGIENGLVDELGGLEDALIFASKAAEIEKDYEVIYLPKHKDFFERLLENIGAEVKTNLTKETLGPLKPYIKQMKNLENMKGVQARMPFELNIIQ